MGVMLATNATSCYYLHRSKCLPRITCSVDTTCRIHRVGTHCNICTHTQHTQRLPLYHQANEAEQISYLTDVFLWNTRKKIIITQTPLTCTLYNVAADCSRLKSAATSTLIVPAMRRRTLGDRVCPVAAARAWNSLPSFSRDEQSLAAFRRQLKTVLFRTSFSEYTNT